MEEAKVKVTLNGEEAQRELDQINNRIAHLIELKKKAEAEGDVKGWKKLSTELSKTEREAKKLEKQFYDIEKTLKNINGASIEDLEKAQRSLVEQTKKMTRGTDEYIKKQEQLKTVRGELSRINSEQRNHMTLTGKIIDTAKGLLPAFGWAAIGAGAVMAFNKIKNSTDTLSTKWAVFMGGMREASNEFFRTLATGNWDNFVTNMRNAIEVGREYERMLDDIEAKQRALSIAESDAKEEIVKLEEDLRNKGLTDEQRLAAGKRRIQIEEQLAVNRSKVAKQEYENEVMIAKQASKLSDEKLQKLIRDLDSEKKIKAEAYNALQDELKKQEAKAAKGGASTGVLFPGMTSSSGNAAVIENIKKQMAGFSPDVVAYAGDLRLLGNVTDEQLNKMVAAYGKFKDAEVSGRESIKRVITMVNNLQAEGNEDENNMAEKKIEAAKKASDKLTSFLQQDSEKQKAAIIQYFKEAGEGAFDEFMAAIEKKQNETKIDFSFLTKTPDEPDQKDPVTDYAIEQFQETLEYKAILLEAQYRNGIISEQKYQDELTEIANTQAAKRFEKQKEFAERATQLASFGSNFVASLMDLELAKAGDNEEKKAEIRKKYANMQFLVTSSQIIVDTAAAIMKALAELGPIAGPIAAAIVGATGAIQLGVANAEREKVKGYATGKYPVMGADDGHVYDANYAGRPKTGIYSGPQIGLFNEDPSRPELVVDGRTTRQLMINYPAVYRGIRQLAAGGSPQFAEGKYPDISVKTSSGISDETFSRFIQAVDKLLSWTPSIDVKTFKEKFELIDEYENGGLK